MNHRPEKKLKLWHLNWRKLKCLCSKYRSTLGTESEDELQAQVFKDDIYMISSKNNKARVVESDIVGENVVIHIIDSILE